MIPPCDLLPCSLKMLSILSLTSHWATSLIWSSTTPATTGAIAKPARVNCHPITTAHVALTQSVARSTTTIKFRASSPSRTVTCASAAGLRRRPSNHLISYPSTFANACARSAVVRCNPEVFIKKYFVPSRNPSAAAAARTRVDTAKRNCERRKEKTGVFPAESRHLRTSKKSGCMFFIVGYTARERAQNRVGAPAPAPSS